MSCRIISDSLFNRQKPCHYGSLSGIYSSRYTQAVRKRMLSVTREIVFWENSNPSNYRPVSLTCIICKLFDHIIASHIMQHLEDNNILYDLQHDFRRKRSCESQLLSLVHELMHNYDNNIQSDLIQMDFAKAFDKVPHK